MQASNTDADQTVCQVCCFSLKIYYEEYFVKYTYCGQTYNILLVCVAKRKCLRKILQQP